MRSLKTLTIALVVSTLLTSAVAQAQPDGLSTLSQADGGTSLLRSRRVDVIQARDTDQWTLTLRRGNSYTIVVDGDGDTDLDAYLYDENGNLIDKDDDGTDYCVLEVAPKWTGKFTLRIVNRGRMANRYEVLID